MEILSHLIIWGSLIFRETGYISLALLQSGVIIIERAGKKCTQTYLGLFPAFL